MAEYSTIARPYAQGVFQLAKARNGFAKWSDMLEYATAVIRDPTMNALIGSPKMPRDRLAQLVIDICGDRFDEQGRNLVRLLAENRRLLVLPEIAAQYAALRAEAEATIHARLITAQPVAAEIQPRLEEALGKRLGRKVTLTTETDAHLLGGAIIRAGDLVIDGSVRGRLERLAATLSR
jgi:F-type H+-transporting ATPase subunit delta